MSGMRHFQVTGHEVSEFIIAVVILIIGIVIELYALAYAAPQALTTLSTAAFTSVNAGVVALLQILTPLVLGFVVVLANVGLIGKFV